MGAAAVLSGISSRSWVAEHGLLDAAQPLALMIPDGGTYQVNTRLVVVENTHNFGGGTVQPLDQIEALRAGTRAAGRRDAPRRRPPLERPRRHRRPAARPTAALFDTVSVCLSKGLGAPVGSVLVGSRDLMAQARIWRKRFGGGMRQVGILAAAGLHALDHHVERLADDHARARRFAEAAAAAAPGSIDPRAGADQHRRPRRGGRRVDARRRSSRRRADAAYASIR